MLCTAELDMVKTVTPNDVDDFLDNAAWAICSTYHTVLKASPDTTIFGHNMFFNILFMAANASISKMYSLRNRYISTRSYESWISPNFFPM
jgi:hypothetical protein